MEIFNNIKKNELFAFSMQENRLININLIDAKVDNQDQVNYDLQVFLVQKYNDNFKLCDNLSKLDDANSNEINQFLKYKNFKGKMLETANNIFKFHDKLINIAFIGIDNIENISTTQIFELGRKINQIINNLKAKNPIICFSNFKSDLDAINNILLGINYDAYKFDMYLSKKSCSINNKPIVFNIQVHNKEKVRTLFENKTRCLMQSMQISRDLGNCPPNDLYPESYANYIKHLFTNIENVTVEILDEDKMKALGMNCLLGVGQGSARTSQTVIIKYKGDKTSNDFKLSLVGKGVCFDSGGISLKPSGNMDQMKYDMCGSSAVIGATYAAATTKANINIATLVGLVENMPDGNAQRPGDIVKSMSGKTVEILNTDAEGRLVLIDLFEYVAKHIKPQYMINLATLTGAIGVALGSTYAGLFTNNDALQNALLDASKETDEKIWPMPSNKYYLEQMQSTHADIANIATKNPGHAGSCTAYAFLSNFVNKDEIKHAHIDIATISSNCNYLTTHTKGATSFGVRLLNEFVKNLATK